MATPENTFITSVHRHLPVELYRMKNHNQYNGGIADVWYSGKSDCWIEYKFIKVPFKNDTVIDLVSGKKPTLSHLQQHWLQSRHQEGRTVGVIVGSVAGGVVLMGLAWQQPLTVLTFQSMLDTRAKVAQKILAITSACRKQT